MENQSHPAERSEPLLHLQESHLRPNRRAPGGESSTIHPTGLPFTVKAWALPVAGLSLVLNLIFVIIIIIISTQSANPLAACPDGWVGYLGKCYYFSKPEANWTSSQKNCFSVGASLAGIDSQQEMDFLMRYKGHLDYWIGLQREPGQAWKWSNSTEFNNWFSITGEEQCAFLSSSSVASLGCWSTQPWICSKPA